MDPDIWRMDGSERKAKTAEQKKRAKAICAECTVCQACLIEYTSTRERTMERIIAGGMTNVERKAYVKLLKQA